MFAEFEKYIKAHTTLSDDELGLIRSVATIKTIRKKQALLQQGEICRYKMFVIKGFLRMYGTREDGSEHIMQFIPEHTWTTEAESYNNFTPSNYNIEALEDSQVILWAKADFDKLFVQIPRLKAYSEQIIFHNLHLTRQRIFSAISSTVEEKYEDFIKNNPGIVGRVPLRMVASYLGISLKTLSRIRQSQLQR